MTDCEDCSNLYFSNIITKSLQPINSDDRYFEGYLTVQVKDKQGEITIVDELYKVLPIWMDRGAPISDTHSNRIIGKGINYSKSSFVDKDGSEYPAIKITGKIHKNYELDNEIWNKIKSGEYKGLSFGGATRTNREPIVMKDGSIAYALKELEHYEVAVCKDPAVPLALITDHNNVAKAMADHTEDRGDGKMVIKCSKFGCYVEKKDSPCWEGYEQIGMKEKDGKMVPNCVPKGSANKATHDKDGDGDEDSEDWKIARDEAIRNNEDEEDDVKKDSLIKIEDEHDKNTKAEVLDEWKNDDNDHGEEDEDDEEDDDEEDEVKKTKQLDPNPENDNPDEIMERAKVVGTRQDIYRANEDKPLNKPMRDDGNKKFKVYVKDPSTGNVITVRFGDPNMEIKRDDPERRASFRARHNCDNAKDITSAGYWSCKMWEKSTSVSEYTNKDIETIVKADLGKYSSFAGKVQALMDEGYAKENAENIVGSFVKGEKKKEGDGGGNAGIMTADTEGAVNTRYGEKDEEEEVKKQFKEYDQEAGTDFSNAGGDKVKLHNQDPVGKEIDKTYSGGTRFSGKEYDTNQESTQVSEVKNEEENSGVDSHHNLYNQDEPTGIGKDEKEMKKITGKTKSIKLDAAILVNKLRDL